MATLYRLQTDQVLRLLGEQELKKWWVAEFSGIHKTTLRRWLSGRIQRVQERNVTRLASLLAVPIDEIARPMPAL